MKPNIIMILIDDMGWRDLGCFGSTFYETPNIDALCGEGMMFTNAYASCPVCSPTRASLLTGKYPATLGVTNWIGGHETGRLVDAPYVRELSLSERTIATALREHGYATCHVGKWHLGGRNTYPDMHGFDINIGGCSWGNPKQGHFAPYGIETLPEGPDGEYLADRLTDEAIRLIDNSVGAPFFLNLWHYAVHTPIQAPEALIKKYERKRADMGLDRVMELEEGEHFPTTTKRDRRVVRRRVQSDPAYAAMIENLDTNVGRVMDALKRKGIDDNTIVIFYSDNGGLSTAQGSPTTNAPLPEGKGWMYDGGVREPLIVRWPGRIQGGSVCETPVTTPDLYPTLLALAGADEDVSHLDGADISALLMGGEMGERPIYWHYPHYGDQGGTPGAAVRLGDWKLIRFFEDERRELYNLAEDIGEEREVSLAHPDKTARLDALLCDWMASVDAKIPRLNPDWA